KSRCRQFDSGSRHHHLGGRAYRAEVAQLVAHHLAKVRVAGSSPVFRSISLPTEGRRPPTADPDAADPRGAAAPSSSGRTADFGSVNRGSNPRGAANWARLSGTTRRRGEVA